MIKNKETYSKNKRIITYLKFVLLLIVIIGIPVFLYLRYGPDLFSKDTAFNVISYLRENRNISFLMLIGLQAAQVIICILPGQPIQFAASYMFGISVGLVLSLIGAVIGTAISFYLAKLLGRDMIHLFFDEKQVENYHSKLNSGRGLAIAGLIYLLPGVPKDLVSYVAGISEMKFKSFILVSTISRCPAMIGSLLLGHYFNKGNYTAIAAVAAVVAIVAAISIIKREKILNFLDKLEN